jgi:hypothetical protein
VLPLVQQYSWAIDLQICVFPQEGLLNNPGTDELMVEALERGCRAIGRRALYRQQIRLVARRPREVASPITNGGTPSKRTLVCRDRFDSCGFGGTSLREAIEHETGNH